MPADPQRNQVFLSYSHNDRQAAVALRAALEGAGLPVFHDEQAIRTGDQWMTRLQDALQGCSAFAVLVGRDGVRRWVGAEVQVALNRHLGSHDEAERLPIFPILLEGTSPETLPPLLGLFQAASWSGAAESLSPTLLEGIRKRSTRLQEREHFEGCPFLGLDAFQQKDARLFFGRRQETLEALASLGSQQEANPENLRGAGGTQYIRWSQIEGNSGSGKSSLVNAGMLPMVERGALWARTGFDRWRVLGPMLPGRNPLEKLAEVLEHALVPEGTQRDTLQRLKRLEQDERALALMLRDCKQDDTAFLLIVDQFEELFTLAEPRSRKRFDAQLAHALQDAECPLFMITTVRADFLDRFEQLPRLQSIYNSRCKRFSLPTISEQGLREVIEQPARLAGLDVREVTAAILNDAREEIGALPLVENALYTLWQKREGDHLSGTEYRLQNGIAGMLQAQADALLARIDSEVPKGREAALELLLRLTSVNDEGRHSRQRISREEAVGVAGNGDRARGERVVQLLAGERALDGRSAQHAGVLRLITIHSEQGQQYVDLIHETLIRARCRDEKSGERIGYWPTLYDFVEKNRDRDLHRQQLKFHTEQWLQSRGLGRFTNLAGWRDLRRYHRLRVRKGSSEARFLSASRWKPMPLLVFAISVVGSIGVIGEAAWWAHQNKLPVGYVFMKPLWTLGWTPEGETVEVPKGEFTMGCVVGRDDSDGRCSARERLPQQVAIPKPFRIGKYEVTFLQYDAFVWDTNRKGNTDVTYPLANEWGRFDRPVINVSAREADAYIEWLNRRTKKSYRLPTEAEWEYAARAGTQTKYWWGNDFDEAKANCVPDRPGAGMERTTPVGSFEANCWGLHDTAGNVWEYVEVFSHSKPREQWAARNSVPPDISMPRTRRGGSWEDLGLGFCKPFISLDHIGRNNTGFRVLLPPALE